MKDYQTQDLNLVISLKALGFKWKEVAVANSRTTFLFEETPSLEATINRYYLGEVRVEPAAVLSAHRIVKKLVREGQNG